MFKKQQHYTNKLGQTTLDQHTKKTKQHYTSKFKKPQHYTSKTLTNKTIDQQL